MNVQAERRFHWMRTVMHSSISMCAKLIYWELDDHAGYRAACWPHQLRVAKFLGISPRSVVDGIRELCERGFLAIEPKGKSRVYLLAWGQEQVQNLHLTPPQQVQNFPEQVQNLHLSESVSLYEQRKEQRNEQRCSLCGDSGIVGSTGADVALCSCAAGRKTA